MSWNGTGTFSALTAPTFPAVTGTLISSAYYNAVINDAVTGINTCLAKDGQNSMTGILRTVASAVGSAGLRVPHGTAPTSPADGDLWTTTAGLFVRINGATVSYAVATQANNGISMGTGSAGTAGNNNTSYGNSTLTSVTAGGNDNVGIGYQAGTAITTGDNNICIGSGAGKTFTTGGDNTVIGKDAGKLLNTLTNRVVVIGSSCVPAYNGSPNAGTYIGYQAANAATSLVDTITIIGHQAALAATTIGANATFIGNLAGSSSTTIGSGNVGIGSNALKYAAGTDNVAVGTSAGSGNGSHSAGTFIGSYAGAAVTSGGDNTHIGNYAGSAVNTGASNTFVGSYGGSGVTSGGTNTFLGYNTGSSITTTSNNTFVGANYIGTAGWAGYVVLATGAGTARFWHDGTDAYVSHATTASAANAFLDSGTSKLQRSTSSIRYKRDVEPMKDEYRDAVLALEPKWYRSKCEGDPKDWGYWGFIAEEAAKIDPRLVFWEYLPEDMELVDGHMRAKEGAEKVPGGFAYDRLTVHLLALAKKQDATITSLESRLATLEATINGGN